ncbi:MAG: hypothetical protein Q9M13_03070, partial [Mariprofundales bacterium]|nr:hypothetical protein [Mariprofundales bacterium]
VSEARVDMSVWVEGGQALLMALWSPRGEFDRWQPQFDEIVASLHGYSRQRDGAVPHIVLQRWHRGDDWRKLAARTELLLGPFTADRLAALNGMDLQHLPQPGYLIKSVQ